MKICFFLAPYFTFNLSCRTIMYNVHVGKKKFQIKNIYYKLELTIYLHNVELTTALAVHYNY